ncbi:unnamed protein product [Urochloa humidicola]
MAMASAATLLGFTLLTCNSIMAIVKSQGDVAATAFVVTSYTTLLLLFYFLHLFEASPQGSAARDRARVGVWLATTLLGHVLLACLGSHALARVCWCMVHGCFGGNRWLLRHVHSSHTGEKLMIRSSSENFKDLYI